MVFGPREPSAVFNVAEEAEFPRHQNGGAIGQRLLPAGDVVEDQLGNVGVVADDDEHWRRLAAQARFGVVFPKLEVLLVVVVQALQRAFEFGRQLRFAGQRLGPAPLLRQVVPNAIPEVAVGGLLARHRIVGDRNTRDFHDAGLDGVDQGEIRNHPRKQRPFPVAGASQEERRRRKIVDRAQAGLAL